MVAEMKTRENRKAPPAWKSAGLFLLDMARAMEGPLARADQVGDLVNSWNRYEPAAAVNKL